MSYLPIDRRPQQGVRNQRGVALVVSLLLLIIVAIVGLAAVRGTIMQQKMSSNAYDREQAFQAAEAALRVAVAVLPTAPNQVSRNCQTLAVSPNPCLNNPFTDIHLPANSVYTVNTGSGSSTTFTASAVAAAKPQYVIEFMGAWDDPNGAGNNSNNSKCYGCNGSSSKAMYYRITARSGDPALLKDRAIVTIQTNVKLG